MGGLAALWTPQTSEKTLGLLVAARGAGIYPERPFWRYEGPGSNPNSPFLTRGRGWKPPYGDDCAAAKDALQIPLDPTGPRKIEVPWYEPVVGPRATRGNPSFGAGGGPEYFRGWKFPPPPPPTLP